MVKTFGEQVSNRPWGELALAPDFRRWRFCQRWPALKSIKANTAQNHAMITGRLFGTPSFFGNFLRLDSFVHSSEFRPNSFYLSHSILFAKHLSSSFRNSLFVSIYFLSLSSAQRLNSSNLDWPVSL